MPKVLVYDFVPKGSDAFRGKDTYLELAPDFLHFTRKVNLPLIAKYKKLCAKTPKGAQTGCSIGTQSVYAYNLELIQKTQCWATLPSGVISETEQFCCLLFNADPNLWVYFPEECATKYCREIDSPVDCPLGEYEIISVKEAFELAGTDMKGVCLSKLKVLDGDLDQFIKYYGRQAATLVCN